MTTDDDLTDEEFNSVIGHYRIALNGLMRPLTRYGQGDYVAGAINQLVSLGVQLHFKLSGVDEVPYMVEDLHW